MKTKDRTVCLCAVAALVLWVPHSVAAAVEAPPMKPVITGFIDMQKIKWHNDDDGKPQFTLNYIKRFPGLFGGIVLNATWSEMQPRAWGPLNTARIDHALNEVRRYNLIHRAAPLGVKLRIYSGNQAPEWAKRIGGPITIQRNPAGCQTPGNCPITIGAVWSPRYIAAWRAFQRKVAARYDSDPLIRSVAITSCAMETDEPFVMPTSEPPQPPPPPPPGYTDKAGKACLRGAVDDYAAWQRTAIDYTLNPFINIQTQTGVDVDFTISVLKECRKKLRKRCELGNHAFEANITNNNLTQVIAAIAAAGPPIHYQTVGPNKKGFEWAPTMRAARQDKATAIELWPVVGGFTTLSNPRMRQLRALFGKPALPTDAAP